MGSTYIVYYQKKWGLEIPSEITLSEFTFYYCHVRSMIASGLNEVYHDMQGEIWSPNGEQREYIKSLGLLHTSMSVGDVVYSVKKNKYYKVAPIGFEELRIVG